ncbi:transglycosylase SLT domain-containing protein [Streptomyces sp. NPDC005017]|uniref:transglycosylase SLT domain-containing protein n=1 Tax=Streptomyces sp. NPDC005017 TaxID=3364706 RepID=UPI0036A08058
MPKHSLNTGRGRALAKSHKLALAGVSALGAAALAFSVVPANADTTTAEAPAAPVAYEAAKTTEVRASLTDRLAAASVKVEAIEAQQKAAEKAAAQKKAAAEAKQKAAAEAKRKAAAKAAAEKAAAKAAKERAAKKAASRSAARPQVQKVVKKSYGNNLHGWISEALDIMHDKGIPGTYNGLHRNIMRESSGNPNAINNWDINAQNGVPSIGLLQIIKPTFDAYHVSGTAWSQYDPVANLTAAANYAADRYGSIDNVNSAY